ncbi:MAG: IS66 family transposase [Dehalococcoidia bacterium]
MIVVLRLACRLPLGQVRRYLREVHQLAVSEGEVVAVLALAAACGTPVVDALLAAVRAEPVVHADETSWREQGQNGYLWSVSTPTRHYYARGSRQKGMVDTLLGDGFSGVLGTRGPADNNAAERSVRPLAVVRKISGGTRSAAGSLTRTMLSTITQSWQAQGQHLLDAWTTLLRDPTTAPV